MADRISFYDYQKNKPLKRKVDKVISKINKTENKRSMNNHKEKDIFQN